MFDSDVVAITQLVNLYGPRWTASAGNCSTASSPPRWMPITTSHWTGLERFKSDFDEFHRTFDSTQHTRSTHVIEVDGDKAHSFCNGGWRLLLSAAGDHPTLGWHGLV